MKLVIVESPTKARTIGKFLGKGYEIRASMGHIMDLPKSTLGVDIENSFAPQYVISEDKKKTISDLKKLAKDADGVILATDPDREGEAISAHIAEVLSNNSQADSHKFVRITFHEITKEAIEEALTHPGKVNAHLVDAQTARRVLDRLVGYKLSPLLWQKVRRGLSAGRVQSVALRLIVEREREIEKFKKEDYYTVTVTLSQSVKRKALSVKTEHVISSKMRDLSGDGISHSVGNDRKVKGIDFDLIEINNEKIEISEKHRLYDGDYTVSKTIIDSQEKADAIVAELPSKKFRVVDVIKKETKRSPQPPFTTSTLQQQAAQRFGYSGKRTMTLAQKLYEEGYITYHRTDSVTLATSAISAMRGYIEKTYGVTYIPESPRFYSARQKLAQEAHEAIRPTKVTVLEEHVAKDLGKDFAKLYDLIWRRAVSSQMSDAKIESTTVYVGAWNSSDKTQIGLRDSEVLKLGNSDNTENSDTRTHRVPSESHPDYLFKTTGSILLFEGFLKVNPFGLEDKKLPNFLAAEVLDFQKQLAEKHETTPPPRYNDASLIKSLEEAGIGRPSTYATIISTIEARQYIEREQKKFIPTPVGMSVNDFLVKNFSDIDDIPFTAEMEDKFDAIANGEEKWVPMITDFYTPFEKELDKAKNVARVEIPTEETGEKCPKDGAPLVIRVGRFGKFVSCKNFPQCDFKKQYVETTQYTCPKDGGKVIIKKTRKGRPFYGCSNYPACDFAVWKLEDLKKQEKAKQV